jgi:hypothetical protein
VRCEYPLRRPTPEKIGKRDAAAGYMIKSMRRDEEKSGICARPAHEYNWVRIRFELPKSDRLV